MPVEDISNSLEDLGFNVNVKQMTATQIAPNGQNHMEPFPLFLVTLTRNIKSQEKFKLNSLNHIIFKADLNRDQTGLTQCYNCQNFGHVWANCKQPPQCMWCGGGHLHRECPEKTNTESRSSCCNCTPVEGKKSYPVSYRGCRHVKVGTAKEKSTTSSQGIIWRMFFSKFTSQDQSYAAALCQDMQHQQPQAP
jgi:hypothetical protein